jgi:hypothetical protein
MATQRRVLAGAVAFALCSGPIALASVGGAPTTGPTPVTQSSHRDTVEVWRVHPSKTAARAATMTLRISDVDNGDRGALMVVEDRHIPVTAFDTSGVYGFAYAELGNNRMYPEVYDNRDGIAAPGCPVSGSCLGLNGAPMHEGPLTFTFGKVVEGRTGKPARYDFHDFYVGAVNAHLTVIPQNDGWSVSRATNADMVLVQNGDTKQGVGARVANYTVEQFNDEITVKTPDALWSEAFAGLPCTSDIAPEYPVAQGSATFTGFTIPMGRPSIPLACKGSHFEEAMANGPTTWRVTPRSSGTPGNVTTIAPAQNLNRLVVLIVDRGKPRPTLIVPPKHSPLSG